MDPSVRSAGTDTDMALTRAARAMIGWCRDTAFESSPPGGTLTAATARGLDQARTIPNFERAVVLVLDHGDDGALGVVLNRPTPVPVGRFSSRGRTTRPSAPPGVVFRGGPVSLDAVIGLARAASPEGVVGRALAAWCSTRWAPWTCRCPPTPNPSGSTAPGSSRGTAGWAADQLEAELAEGAWFVLDASADDVFCVDPDKLWHDVMRRQGGTLSLLAAYPSHPSLN